MGGLVEQDPCPTSAIATGEVVKASADAREVVQAQGRSPFLARGRSSSNKVGGVHRGFGGCKGVRRESGEVDDSCSGEVAVERGREMSLKLWGKVDDEGRKKSGLSSPNFPTREAYISSGSGSSDTGLMGSKS